MKKRSLTIVILLIIALIFTVIIVDVLNNRPDRRGENPYALEVEQFREVDPELISHRETRNLSLGQMKASAIDILDRRIVVVGGEDLVTLSLEGKQLERRSIAEGSVAVTMNSQACYVAYPRHVSKIHDLESGEQEAWKELDERTVITNMALGENALYVADAGNRRVLIYSLDGELVGEFEGKAETEAGHGFIVPSANFDLLVNDFAELWVVNPARHALENYSDEGRLRGYWSQASFEIEGFLGCCNPARIAPMSEGRIATSEKGMVRIKIYGPSGDLKSVVAGPDLFKEEGKAPDIAVEGETIYALDYERNTIRIFEVKEDE